jgi:hypothetical protein
MIIANRVETAIADHQELRELASSSAAIAF